MTWKRLADLLPATPNELHADSAPGRASGTADAGSPTPLGATTTPTGTTGSAGRTASLREITCVICRGTFATNQARALFCSKKCRKFGGKKRLQFPGVDTSTVGTIQELRVSMDLLSTGYEVFRALSGGASCDLAVVCDGILVRIEVRTAYRSASGEIVRNRGGSGKRDHFAWCLPDEIVYEPPLPPPGLRVSRPACDPAEPAAARH